MKRRAPEDLSLRPARVEFDPKKAYTPAQLAEIGAIAIRWNQIEGTVGFIATFMLFPKSPFWLRVTLGKKLSAKSKLELLKDSLEHTELLDATATQCISDCISQVEECRSYRNAIIHHHIYDHEKGIGAFVDWQNTPFQILVSIEALTTLYNILCTLLDELREIDLLFRMETDAQTPGLVDRATGLFTKFDDEKLKTEIIPVYVAKIKALQDTRKRLHKLPQFPDADLIRAMSTQVERSEPE